MDKTKKNKESCNIIQPPKTFREGPQTTVTLDVVMVFEIASVLTRTRSDAAGLMRTTKYVEGLYPLKQVSICGMLRTKGKPALLC
jgi:hypothetical protein